jgi:bacillaene synthase trans-acting acyltransferase
MRSILVFTGQGAQYYNMGKGWFQTNPIFAYWMRKADDLIQKRWNRSLLHALYTDFHSFSNPIENLDLSHPSLFAVQYAVAMSLTTPIDLVLGASLGEFVAMTVAGAISFESAFCHVLDQVELFQQSLTKGKMIAVLDSKENIEAVLSPFRRDYEYAAELGPQHYTLSIPLTYYTPIKELLTTAKCLHQTLPINYPFHSIWIDPIKSSFLQLASTLPLSNPSIPCASCAGLHLYNKITPNDLWKILREPMQIQKALNLFLKEGDRIIDCSPSGAIKGLLRALFGNNSPLFIQTESLMSPYNPTFCSFPSPSKKLCPI